MRAAAFTAAVLLHTPVFFIAQPRPKSSSVPALTIVRLEIGQSTAASLPRDHTRTSPSGPVPPPTASPPDMQPASGEAPAPAVDWKSSGAGAARGAVESLIREEGYRPLGPREQRKYALPTPPTIFQQPKHELGDAEMDPLNYDLVWHNDRCYTELGKPVTPRADARVGNANPPKCKLIGLGKKETRGDLFEHLKPDYLK